MTHIVNIYLPYLQEGRSVTLQFGLSKEMPVDVWTGVNFQNTAKMIINLGENKVYTPVIRQVYKIMWEWPQNKPLEQVATVAEQQHAVFISQQNEELVSQE